MLADGGELHSESPQHPPVVETQVLVPEQFLNPVLHMIPQVPPVHTAEPFEEGALHELQPVPQNVVLVSGWQIPEQLWVLVGHIPLQAMALEMQAPLHSLVLLSGQAGTQARPSQLTVPPPLGA